MRTRHNWGDWNEKRLLRFMIGQHTPDVDQDNDLVSFLGQGDKEIARQKVWINLHPKKMVTLVRKMGAEVFYYYAKCHYGNTYYPSKTGHVHSLTRGRDYFGEITQACIEADIIPVALYECMDIRIQKEKPEWCFKREDGSIGFQCFNSPYCEFVLKQAAEIWSEYDIAGLFFDMVDYHGLDDWECPYCADIYRKDFGSEFKGTAGMSAAGRAKYYDWCQKQVAGFLKKLKTLRNEIAPGCRLEHNFHGVGAASPGHGWKDTIDLTGGFGTDTFAFGSGSVVDIYFPKMYRNAKPGTKSFLLLDTSYSCMADTYDTSTPRPYDFYLAEAASVLANDIAFCSSIFVEIDGNLDRTQMEVIRRLNSFFKPRKPWLTGTQIIRYAAVVFPGRSRDIAGKKHGWRYEHEFSGWVRLLAENHVIFDVIVDELLDESALAQYKILILPNVEALSDSQLLAIERFVERGGMLIATGNTSLGDVNGMRRQDFGLKTSLGVSLVNPLKEMHSYIHLTDDNIVDEDKTVSPWIYLPDGQAYVNPLDGTSVLAKLGRKPETPVSYLRHETKYPSITVHKRVYYFAGEPGLAYARYQYPAIPRLVKRILKPYIDENMPVHLEVCSSVQVEVTTQEKPKRLIVHLINHSGNSGWTVARRSEVNPSFLTFTTGQPHKITPVNGIKISIRKCFCGDVKSVYLAPSKEAVPFKVKDGLINIEIKRLNVYEIVVLE